MANINSDLKNDLLRKTDEYDQLVVASRQIEAELEKDFEEAEEKANKWRQLAQRFEGEVQDAREKMAAHFREYTALQ
ncbi:hypothetical protein As57867_006771, partial [Aphanomyces stellatus]